MPALLFGSVSCLRGNVLPEPIRLVAYAMGPSCPWAAMSDEWPGLYHARMSRARPTSLRRPVPPGGTTCSESRTSGVLLKSLLSKMTSASSATRAPARWWSGTSRRRRYSSTTSSPATPSLGPRSDHRVTTPHAPRHGGYEFKTRAPHVGVCIHLLAPSRD